MESFVKGYKQVQKLSEEELKAIPWLIVLRLVSNCIYFVGRVVGGL
jgi:Ser/Thr protein kinase RdoA (MazF antagonist)